MVAYQDWGCDKCKGKAKHKAFLYYPNGAVRVSLLCPTHFAALKRTVRKHGCDRGLKLRSHRI